MPLRPTRAFLRSILRKAARSLALTAVALMTLPAAANAAPDIRISPASHNYQGVLVGAIAFRAFTVYNDGNSTLNVSSVTLKGPDAGQFSVVSSTSFSVSAGSSVPIYVSFQPTSLGIKSALLHFTSNDPDESGYDVPITGSGVRPEIVVSPTALDYGAVVGGKAASRTLFVTNAGSADLHVASTSVVGTNASEFSYVHASSFTLSPSQSTSIEVWFSPVGEGPRNATLRFSSDDPDDGTLDVPLTGTGVVMPDLVVSPSAHDFGAVLGGESSSRTFQILNDGTADLHVSSLSIVGGGSDDFSLLLDPGAFTLGSGASTPIVVRFHPMGAGPRAATLRIYSDDPDENPYDVALSGTGILPEIAVDPDGYDYGGVPGGESSTRSFEVRNDGSAELQVSSVSLVGGNSTDFQIVSNPGSFLLSPSQSIRFDVRFAPIGAGARNTSLRFVSNDPERNPLDIALTGQGLLPDVAVSPASHDYGGVPAGDASSRTFAIINEGAADLTVTSVEVSGDAFSLISDPGSFALSPGATMPTHVRFHPTDFGPMLGTLRVFSNDPEENPLTVPLSGMGLPPDIEVSPPSHDYGEVARGESSLQTFRVSNGGAALHVSEVSIVGAQASDFELQETPAPFTLSSHDEISIGVRFRPGGAGTRNAALRFVSDDPDENPLDVPLTGMGLLPEIVVSPASHDFGSVAGGQTTSTTFQIRNEGNVTLRVDSVSISGADATHFTLTFDPGSFDLFPGGVRSVEVEFSPSSGGLLTAALRIVSDDPDEYPFDVPLSGTGVMPRVSISPASHDFGAIPHGQRSPRVFHLTNVGTVDLSVSSISIVGPDASLFELGPGPVAFTLAPAESLQLEVTFIASGDGSKSAALRVESNDPSDNPFDVPLTGISVLPVGAPITFAAAGDYPYGLEEIPELQTHISLWNQYSDAEFLCHVGDIIGHEPCYEAWYVDVASVLRTSEIPVFVIPGDNEWVDCPDASLGWAWWSENFSNFEENFCLPFHVERQAVRNENFAFVRKGVLFVGVNIPSGDADYEDETIRLTQDAEWVSSQFEDKFDDARVAIVFGHAGPDDGGERDTYFFSQFRAAAASLGKPVLYIMGNDHSWELDQPFPEPNVWRLVVRRGGSEQPVEITVGMDMSSPFAFQRDPWENDPAPHNRPACDAGEIYVSDATVTEGGPGGVTVDFTVSLAGGDGRAVDVSWATAPGTAGAGTDFVNASGVSTLSGESRSRPVTITIAGDAIPENPEEFYVDLTSATAGAAILRSRGIGTILDDDPPYPINVSTIGSGSVSFTPPGGAYAHGDTVALLAVADPGWEFGHWDGALLGTANPETLVVLGSTNVTVTFTPNAPPVAGDDSFTTDEDLVLFVGPPGVLGNDSDPEFDPLSVAALAAPGNGSVTLHSDGSFEYQPIPNFFGRDQFTYRLDDGRGASDTATVTIDVRSVNDAPSSRADEYAMTKDSALLIAPPGILGNDSDADGDPLSSQLFSSTSHGTLSLGSDGSFTYVPATGFAGTDTFRYRAYDGVVLGAITTVTLSVNQPGPVVLGPTDDTFVKSTDATQNFGSNVGLRSRAGSPYYVPYLRFVIPDVSIVTTARLRLYGTDPNPEGGTVYRTSTFYAGTSTPWTEGGLNFGNAPSIEGAPIGSLGPVGLGEWVEIDVTSAIDPDGILCLAIQPTSSNTAWFSSKEGANPPELVIDGAPLLTDIAVTPWTYAYGAVNLGSSVSQSFEIRSDGSESLFVSGVSLLGPDAGEFTITSGAGSVTLAPGQTRTVVVSFQPSSLGPKSATLSIDSTDPDESPLNVSLTGIGAVADIALRPGSHDFGPVPTSQGALLSVVVANEGSLTLSISSMSLTGTHPSEFRIVTGSPSFTVEPGDSTTIQVSFEPATLGAKSAALRFVSDDPDESPAFVTLEGLGVQPDVAVEPAFHDFGEVLLGEDELQTFLVLNEGNATLSGGAPVITGPGAADFTFDSATGAFALAPTDTLAVTVRFRPSVEGARSASIAVTSDDPDESPLTIPLSGLGTVADIAVSPTSDDFGLVLVGTAPVRTIEVTNEGTGELRVADVSLDGAGSAQFAILDASAFVVSPGASHILEVSFEPASAGSASTTLRLTSNDPDESPFAVSLSGTGVVPDITVTPGRHDFEGVLVGTGASRDVHVTNDGLGPLSVTRVRLLGPDASQFRIVDNPDSFHLGASETRLLQVRFQPARAGSASAFLRLLSTDPDESPHDLPLTGVGIEPDIVAEPSAHDFGGVPVGDSVRRSFTIRNVGTAPLAVSSTEIVGNDAREFTRSAGGETFTLAPAESIVVDVDFHPGSTGAKSAALRLVSDDRDEGTLDVALSGAGIQPDIAILPETHDFGGVLVGSASSVSFEIRNAGSDVLDVTAITIAGANPSAFTITGGGSPASLAPSEATTVEVRFRPAALGSRSAVLRVASTDPDENPFDVPLSGAGVLPGLALDPDSLDFGEVRLGSPESRSIVVHNEGTADLTVSSAEIFGPEGSAFAIVGGPTPLMLSPTESASIEIRFDPVSVGTKRGTLRLTSDDPELPELDAALAGEAVAPDIGVTPEHHDYGPLLTGTTASHAFVVRNDGRVDLAVSSTTIVGPDASEFRIQSGGGTFTLGPTEFVALTVVFEPTSPGLKSASIRLVSDDPDENELLVTLAGGAIEPDIAASPSSHDWGGVLVGASARESFVLRNQGSADLTIAPTTIAGEHASDFSIVEGGGASTLTPGDSTTVEVEFSPGALGARTAELRVLSDDPDESPLAIAIDGEGVQPDVALDRESHEFGGVRLGTTSSTDLVVSNVGRADLTITGLTIDGANRDDFDASSPALPFTLAPGGSATIAISFEPSAPGVRSARIEITSDDPDEPLVSFSASGSGTRPIIALDPTSLDYGDVLVDNPTPLSITIHNVGTADLNLSSLAVTGADANEFSFASPAVPFAVGPGDARNVTVTFTPSSMGAKSAALRFTSDDLDVGVLDAPLAGVGVAPDLKLSPWTHDFGPIVTGSNATKRFVLRNDGTVSLSVVSTTIAGAHAAQFSLSGGGSFALGPGESVPLDVTFAPTLPAAMTGVLRVVTEEDEEPTEAALSGLGVEPDLAVSPSSHDFGAVLVGEVTPHEFTVHNTGTGELLVSSAQLAGPGASEFVLITGSSSFTVPPAGSRTLEIGFAPSSTGARSAVLRLTSNDPDQGILDVALAGAGVEPDISAPISHGYGDVPIGGEETHSIQVRNDGGVELHLNSISLVGANPWEFSVVGPVAPLVIGPHSAIMTEVTFHPTEIGLRSATLSLSSDDPDENPLEVMLFGNGAPSTDPDIAISPLAIDFGSVFEGGSATVTFEVRNEGSHDLLVSSVQATGPNAGDFAVLGGTSFTLASGASRGVEVRFQPSAIGGRTASLHVSSNDPDESPVTISLSGVGVEPPTGGTDIALEETRTGGSTSAPSVTSQDVIGGPEPSLYLASVTAKPRCDVAEVTGLGLEWSRVRSQCSARSQTGMEIWMAVGSSGGGAVTATLSSAPSNAAIVVSRYTGVDVADPIGAVVSANTIGVDGPCSGGVDDTQYAFDLSTTRNGSRVYAAAGLRRRTHEPGSGWTEHADFTQGSGGETAGMAVQELPVANAGTISVEGTFSSTVDWAVVSLEILPGMAPTEEPSISVTPVAHDFGDVVVGTDGATGRFDVSNRGTADLHVTATSLVGAGSFVFAAGSGPFKLAPGESHAIDVRFAPSTVGPQAAELRLVSDDPDRGTLVVPLSGAGIGSPVPVLVIRPTSHDYGDVVTGTSVSRDFEIRNEGSADLTVTATSLTGSAAAEFTIDSLAPFTIVPGGTRDVIVSFRPGTLGAKLATLEVASDDPAQGLIHVALSGTGVEPPPAGGDVALEETESGGSTSSPSVSSGALLGGAAQDLYLAAIASKSRTDVIAVTGLGLTWEPLRAQCSGRNQTGVEIWMAVGSSAGGRVNATFDGTPSNGAIVVSRYSGIDPGDPVGTIVSLNTNGTSGTCSGGIDGSTYSFDLPGSDGTRAYVAAAMRNRVHEPGAGLTERADFTQGSGGETAGIAVADGAIASGSLLVRGTFDRAVDWAAIGLEIRPGAPGVPVADVAVNPSAHDFGNVFVDSTSAVTIEIRNAGSATLTVSATDVLGTDAGEFSRAFGGGAITLAPGAIENVSLRFTPSSAGAKSAVLRIASDDPDEGELDVPLDGTGIDVPPPPTGGEIALEEIRTGGSTSSSSVTSAPLSGGASADLYLAAVTSKSGTVVGDVTGLGSSWSLVRAQCAARGQTRTEVWMTTGPTPGGAVTASFAGTPSNATITVSRYSGVDATNALGAIVSANTLGVDGLCSGGVDTAAYAVTLPASTLGARVYAATSMRSGTHEPGTGYTEHADFTQGSGGGTAGVAVVDRSVDAAGPMAVEGRFSRTVDWALVAFEIRPGAPAEPVADIAVGPGFVDFGALTIGSASTRDVVVRNAGSANLDVTSILLEGSSEFSIESGQAPTTLAPGATQDLVVRFAPVSAGTKSATIRIASNDPDEAVVLVELSGTGVDEPTGGDEIRFEQVVRGGASDATTVTTPASVVAANGDLYLATISTKSFRRATSVNGLGLDWNRVAERCSGRGQTGVDVWFASGTPSGDGAVTAELEGLARSAVLTVVRYSGTNGAAAIGNVAAANTNGSDGACDGGVDSDSYSLDLETTVEGAVIFSAASMRSKTHVPGTGFDERLDEMHGSGGAAASIAIMDRTVATPTVVTVSGTFSGTVDWAVLALEILPGPAAGARSVSVTSEIGPDRRVPGEVEVSSRGNPIPSSASLRGYPNPLRSEATIEYALPEASHVSIVIYDARGREVRRLVDRFESRGVGQSRWNGRDNSGSPVSPGVYFLRMVTESRSVTKKLVVRR